MPGAVLLIRHSVPDRTAGAPNREWSLSADGRVAARRLGRELAPRLADRLICTSDALEAQQTAEEMATQAPCIVVVDERLHEVTRPWIDGDDNYAVVARRYLKGDAIDGWEPREMVRRRMDAAILESDDGRAVVVTHGLAMSVWLDATWPELDVVALWDSLTMPDAWLLDLAAGNLRRVIG